MDKHEEAEMRALFRLWTPSQRAAALAVLVSGREQPAPPESQRSATQDLQSAEQK